MEREARRTEAERVEPGLGEEATRARAQADHRFRELLEAAPDAILEIDRNGRIVLLNPAAEDLFGFRPSELLGQPLELLVPERFRKQHEAHKSAYWSDPARRTVANGRDVLGAAKGRH